jgi:hypothetical protein
MIELSSLPPVATPEVWEAQLRARATHYGLEHIDLLIDQAKAIAGLARLKKEIHGSNFENLGGIGVRRVRQRLPELCRR